MADSEHEVGSNSEGESSHGYIRTTSVEGKAYKLEGSPNEETEASRVNGSQAPWDSVKEEDDQIGTLPDDVDVVKVLTCKYKERMVKSFKTQYPLPS